MKRKRRTILAVEHLENRWVPAPVLSGGNLTIAGVIPANVTVAQQTNGTWNVKYGAVNEGTYTVTGNITINTTNSLVPAGVNTTVSLDPANILPGTLSITTGNGLSDTVSVDTNAAPTTGGIIRGYLLITGGTGTDTFNIGATNGLTVSSLTQITDGGGNDTATIGNGTNTTSLLSDVVITGVNNVTVGATGAATTIGGNLLVGNTTKSLADNYTLNATATVDKGLTLIGGSGADTATLSGTALGATNVTFGNNTNLLTTNTGAIFASDFTYSGGAGADTVRLNTATFGHNLTLNMGDGTNQYTVSLAFTVAGNMNLNAGNGDNNVGAFGGQVTGNLYVTMGNGTNIFDFNGSGNGSLGLATVGGKVVYHSGSGNNTFEVSTGGRIVTLNVTFGTGNDTFTIDTAADEAELTGFLDWGDQVFGNDTFNEPAGGFFVLDWTFYGVQ